LPAACVLLAHAQGPKCCTSTEASGNWMPGFLSGSKRNARHGGDKYNSMEEIKSMATQKMRIKIKAYDHELLDQSAARIIEAVQRTGASFSGPIPLPTEKQIITVLRAVHKYKDSREQFEQRTHKRLIDILSPSQKTVETLMRLDLPAGVDIEIKL